MIAPTFAPELNKVVAKARSALGNHWATVLIAAGKLPASLTPRKIRASMKPSTELTSEWESAAKPQKSRVTA